MTGTEDGLQEAVPAVQYKRVLVGFMSSSAAREMLAGRIGDDGPPLDERYRRARDAIEPLDRPVEEFTVEPLPNRAVVDEHVESFRQSPAVRALDEASDGRWELGLAPIGGLVVFQTDVNAMAHRDLPTWESDPSGVLERVLPTEPEPLAFVSSLDSSEHGSLGVQFTTRNPNVRVMEKRVEYSEGRTSATVSFDVRSKPSFVHVVRFRDRLVLRNGCHRVFQLVRNGETHVPAVITDADSYAQTGGDHSRNFDRRVVLADRPPTVADYDTNAAVEIPRPAHNKVIRCVAETAWVPR